ncbi:MAG: hypothetical protein JWR37_342 [Mycobacterium sp.]|nr:hypothetical protein [Mycobacterium sp.]
MPTKKHKTARAKSATKARRGTGKVGRAAKSSASHKRKRGK